MNCFNTDEIKDNIKDSPCAAVDTVSNHWEHNVGNPLAEPYLEPKHDKSH